MEPVKTESEEGSWTAIAKQNEYSKNPEYRLPMQESRAAERRV